MIEESDIKFYKHAEITREMLRSFGSIACPGAIPSFFCTVNAAPIESVIQINFIGPEGAHSNIRFVLKSKAEIQDLRNHFKHGWLWCRRPDNQNYYGIDMKMVSAIFCDGEKWTRDES